MRDGRTYFELVGGEGKSSVHWLFLLFMLFIGGGGGTIFLGICMCDD